MEIIKINNNAQAMSLFMVREGVLVNEDIFIEMDGGKLTCLYSELELSKDEVDNVVNEVTQKMDVETTEEVDCAIAEFTVLNEGSVIYEKVQEKEPEESLEEATSLKIDLKFEDVEEDPFEEESFEDDAIEEESEIESENMETPEYKVSEQEEVVDELEEDQDEFLSLFDEEEMKDIEVEQTTPQVEEKEEVAISLVESVDGGKKTYPKYYASSKDKEVEELLVKSGVSQEVIKLSMDLRKHNRERIKDFPQMVLDLIPETIEFSTKTGDLEEALGMLVSNISISLIGPTGTGKSTLSRVVATILNYPVFLVNGNIEVGMETFIGDYETKEKGLITARDGQMTLAAKYGGILMVDEINYIPAGSLSVLNPFTDDQREFQNSLKGEVVKSAPETRFICSMNVGDGYEGTMRLNDSLKKRFMPIISNYMTRDELVEIFNGFEKELIEQELPTPSFIQKEQLIKFYGSVTVAASNYKLPEDVGSLKSLKNMFKATGLFGVGRAVRMFILNYDEPEVRAQISGVVSNDGLAEDIGFDPVEFNLN